MISEAYVAAVKYGIDPAAMYETLQSATASSPGHERMVKDSVLARNFDPMFALDLHAKDQQLAADLGKLTGVRMLVTSTVNELYKEAQARGYGRPEHLRRHSTAGRSERRDGGAGVVARSCWR